MTLADEDEEQKLLKQTEEGIITDDNQESVVSSNKSNNVDNEEESESSLDEEKSWEKQREKLGDPMADDFQNPTLNSYKYNHFDVEQEPGYLNRVKALGIPTGTKLYSLNVRHVLPAFNQKGMENIFREFGEILDCKVARLGQDAAPTDKTWATVKFASKMEAANAVAALNGKPPYNFSVAWCMSKDTKERKKKEIKRGEKYAKEFKDVMNDDAEYLDWKKPENDEIKKAEYPENMHEKITNELIKKMKEEKLSDSEESGGVTDSGRGTDESAKRKRMKKQKSDDYEFNPAVDTKPKEFGRPLFLETYVQEDCAHCKKEGRMICSRCGTWYCSLACQENAWEQHKMDCVELPRNLERRLSEVSLNDEGDAGLELHDTDRKDEDQLNHESKLEDETKIAEQKMDEHKSPEKGVDKLSIEPEPLKESVEELPKTKLEAISSHPLFKKQIVKPKVPDYVKDSLPLGEPTPVRVTHVVNPHEFYILPESHRKLWNKVLIDIQDQPGGMVTAKPSVVCLASSDDAWFRTRIEEVLPNGKLKVFCIDFGTTKTVCLNDLKPTVKYSEIGGLVHRVRLDGITPTKDYWNNDQIDNFKKIVDEGFEGEETIFKATLIEKNQKGDLIVKLEDNENPDVGQLCIECGIASPVKPPKVKMSPCEEVSLVPKPTPCAETPSVPKPPPCAKSILTTLIKGSKILLAKDQEAPFTIFGGYMCMHAEDMDYIFNKLREEAQSYRDRGFKSLAPQLKSWVVGYSHEDVDFYRGIIIGVNPPDTYNVLLVDFGFTQKFKGADLLDMWPEAEKDKAWGVRVRNTFGTSESEISAHFEKNKDELGYVEGTVKQVNRESTDFQLTGLRSLFRATPWYTCDPKAKALFIS